MISWPAVQAGRPSRSLRPTSISAPSMRRPGIYGEAVAESVPPDYLGRYFAKVESGYQVTKAIREQCIFATHDLTGDPPFSHLDLVSCRNLLIYLGPVLQKRVIPMLHYALDPGRCLVLGAAETVGSHSALFDVVDKKYRIYRARPRSRHLASELATFEPSAVPVSAEQEPRSLRRPSGPGCRASRRCRRAGRLLTARGGRQPAGDRPVPRSHRALPAPCPGQGLAWPAGDGPEEIAVHLGAAVGDARRSGEPTVRSDVAFHAGGRDELLTLHVVPLPTMGGELHFVVLFESRPAVATKGRTAKATHPQLEETRRELSATRDYRRR